MPKRLTIVDEPLPAANEPTSPDFTDRLREEMGVKDLEAIAAAVGVVMPPPSRSDFVHVSELSESSLNSRRHFAGLDELAASIKKVGILSPLLVRPLHFGNGDKAAYEIVAGHRRFRAAKLAGLQTLPVDIRALTDAQVLECLLIENCQRQDINPMEEAEAYGALHGVHQYSAEQIAEQVGKSKGWVYQRMKLLALCVEGRRALLDGVIPVSVAVPLARIPEHRLQAKALPKIEGLPAADAIHWLQTEFTQSLKGAPFDLKDSDLVPEAGACRTCPKKSGNTPGLFEDIPTHDVCTDTACFRSKCSAQWLMKSAAAEKRGLDVVGLAEGKRLFRHDNELQWDGPYVEAGAVIAEDPKKWTWRELVEKASVEDAKPTLAFIPDLKMKGRECYVRADVVALAVALGKKWAVGAAAKTEESKDPITRKTEDAARDVRKRTQAAVVARAADKLRALGLPELRIMALTTVDQMNCDALFERRGINGLRAQEKWLSQGADQTLLLCFVFEAALTSFVGDTWTGYSDRLKEVASQYNVPLDDIAKASAATIEAEALFAERKAARKAKAGR